MAITPVIPCLRWVGMMDDKDGMMAELERRIDLFNAEQPLGDCMGPCRRIYLELLAYAALGFGAWLVLALAARA
jgi:hypothetical protein